MAFRFKMEEKGHDVEYSPWYKERTPACAPFIMNELRLERPTAAMSIERANTREEVAIDAVAVDSMLREMRASAGWTDGEIAQGFKNPEPEEK